MISLRIAVRNLPDRQRSTGACFKISGDCVERNAKHNTVTARKRFWNLGFARAEGREVIQSVVKNFGKRSEDVCERMRCPGRIDALVPLVASEGDASRIKTFSTVAL